MNPSSWYVERAVVLALTVLLLFVVCEVGEWFIGAWKNNNFKLAIVFGWLALLTVRSFIRK